MPRLRAWLTDRPRTEAMIHLGIVACALVVRLIDLADRPFHHDESQDAYFSWVFAERGDYEYQPILHGPLRFYLTAAMYTLFGDSDFTARLAPALMGTLLVALPYLLRRQIGGPAAIAAAAILAFDPTFLYFSRFAREDIYVAAINLALVVAVFRYLDRPRQGGPAVILGLTALAFATKETTFITLFVAGTFLIVALLVQGRDGAILRSLTALGGVPWAYGLAAFWLVFALLFTVFFTNPAGLWDGIYEGLAYWLGQHDVGRGGEPWYFYLALLFGHEWPVLVLGGTGVVVAIRRRHTLGLFLAWAFVVSLIVYSWAGEKFAWLAMHPLLPLILLAGMGVQALVTAPRGARRTGGIALVAVCGLYLGYATVLASAVHRADPREFLVSTQTSEDAKQVVAQVEALDDRVSRRTGRGITINIDSHDGATYPWAWYFRHLDVGYIDMTRSGYVPQSQVLLMTEQSRLRLLPDLVAYEGRRFRFRVWWVRDWDRKFDPDAWLSWFVDRDPWNSVGGLPGWIFVRRDAAAS